MLVVFPNAWDKGPQPGQRACREVGAAVAEVSAKLAEVVVRGHDQLAPDVRGTVVWVEPTFLVVVKKLNGRQQLVGLTQGLMGRQTLKGQVR
jgi:hypothetical protein